MSAVKVIDKFDGTEYGFLSNFHPCKVTYNGITYNHSEGAFQAQKTLNEEERQFISTLTPGKSKRACGRHGLSENGSLFKIKLRADWEEVKDQIMYQIVKAKFEQNPNLKEKLINTGSAELIEGTTWHDNYWGNCTCEKCKNIEGQNHLGKILMQVRNEFKEQGE